MARLQAIEKLISSIPPRQPGGWASYEPEDHGEHVGAKNVADSVSPVFANTETTPKEKLKAITKIVSMIPSSYERDPYDLYETEYSVAREKAEIKFAKDIRRILHSPSFG